MINIDEVKINKRLGFGVSGTTYLVKYKNKDYILKIQKILEKDTKKEFKNDIWREIDLYKFINQLPKEEQHFFTKLYSYKIYNNCDFIQERHLNLADVFKDLDNSKFCIKYLLEYKKGQTLKDFLIKHNLKEHQILSILLQICKVILILYKAGYSHNDLHPENIIIHNTNKKFFKLFNKNIPYNGYQISVIDYGLVLHKKFGIDYPFNKLLTNPEEHMFNEMYYAIFNIINNSFKYKYDCMKANKKLPWERKGFSLNKITKKIIINYPVFYKTAKAKYLKLYPNTHKTLNYIESKVNEKSEVYDLIKNKKELENVMKILNKIESEFHLYYPKKYALYSNWCSYYEYLLPKEDILNLLIINNYKDFVNYIISII
jgi:serine/threonine protein kinase